MERHFHEELRRLKEQLLKMALLSKEAIEHAARALLELDIERAQKVIDEDRILNGLEIKIDETAHNLLALRQPMAVDMRLLTMILKINTSLERIGDHAVNMAEKVERLCKQGIVSKKRPVTEFCPVQKISALATQVLMDAVEAFLKGDAAAARELLKKDDDIDALNDVTYRQLEERMQKHPDEIPTCLALIMISHDLERIGDLANNIAEDVIYLVHGKEVRHHSEEIPYSKSNGDNPSLFNLPRFPKGQ